MQKRRYQRAGVTAPSLLLLNRMWVFLRAVGVGFVVPKVGLRCAATLGGWVEMHLAVAPNATLHNMGR